jgi:hypothetical protein
MKAAAIIHDKGDRAGTHHPTPYSARLHPRPHSTIISLSAGFSNPSQEHYTFGFLQNFLIW